MVTLQENKILSALQKARGVGLVEESFTVAGCSIVLRNLNPDEYTQILEEIKELEDSAYLYAFQMGHLSRAIVEVAGVDLRNIAYVESSDEQGKNVAYERHEWLRRNVISTWSREAIATAYRKFLDVTHKADIAATEGVTFVVPDENPEDQVKRLLGELKAVGEELPKDVFERLIDLEGFVKKTSREEISAVEQKFATHQEATVSPEDLMRTRKPLNQEVLAEAYQEPVSPKKMPSQVEPVRLPELPVEARRRAAEIAELEAGALNLPTGVVVAERPEERPVLASHVSRIEPATLAQAIDRPPVAGINPRYRRPTTPT